MEENTKKENNNIEQKTTEQTTEKIKENPNINTKKKKNKTRMLIVILFILVFVAVSYIQLRASYLEYMELGQQYISVFYTNLTYKYAIMGINFVVLYFIIYFTNRGIKKGLKPFFEKEKKEMPKLLNKSLALVISAIVSVIVSAMSMEKIMLVISNSSFGITDSIFNMDISYFIFQKPLIEFALLYFIFFMVGLSLYTALYYVIIFNRYFDGIDGKMLKQSIFMKKIIRNIMLIVIGVAILTVLNVQNMVFGKLLTIDDDIDIVGAGLTETTIKLWGYVIFAFIIVIFVYRALKYFKKGNSNKVLKNLAIIPAYLVILFVVMLGFDLIFVNSNELDKERIYISENIKNTKNAYNLNIDEENVDYSGTITQEEVADNRNLINNIPVISEDAVLKTVQDNQTGTGYYSYTRANIAKYKIDQQDQLVYISPREIVSNGRTYNNKTYEYTHGMGIIVSSATESTQTGNVQYVQKEVSGKDEKIEISEPRIYFGMETDNIVATNTKNKQEYDYTDEAGNDQTSTYSGKAGLNLGFLDRLILGISKGDINLAFSGEITEESKILINRNVIQRAKKALPYLIYDENPYTVVNSEGRIIWVIDAYTVSSQYPYSQYTSIEHDGIKESINYIRNSVKVLVDSYDGTISFYITDRTDPIAMAYRNMYKDLFVDIDEQIPEDISEHFVYPKFLYDVQSEVLKVYHNVKPDVLYRADDLWDIAKSNTIRSTTSTGTYMEPYYTMVKNENTDELGLVQVYTPNEKQNIISYLVGTTNGATNNLKLYKFSADSNVLGAMQLDKQIEEDEAISSELDALNVTGTRVTKSMIIVPVENTLLYVEPIYQTMLNESDVPILKKVVVASGNKVAIGDNLTKALENLLSRYAVDIEIENTDDMEGLIEAVIKANNNLTESSNNNDWEMMGSDIKRLQELINSLEKMKQEEDEKQKELEESTNQLNSIDSNNVGNANITGNAINNLTTNANN